MMGRLKNSALSKSTTCMAVSLAVVSAVTGEVAFAQAWLGQMAARMKDDGELPETEKSCMFGAAPDIKDPGKILAKIPEPLREYWTAISSTNDISHAVAPNVEVRVFLNGHELSSSEQAATADPLAITGSALADAPTKLVISGDLQSALGQWRVLDSAGTLTGTYDVVFVQKKNNWTISRIEIFRAEDILPRIKQFCHTPGDVEQFATMRALDLASDAKAAAQSELDKAIAKLELAQATLARSPDDRSKGAAAQSLSEVVEQRRAALEAAEQKVNEAIKAEAAVRHDSTLRRS